MSCLVRVCAVPYAILLYLKVADLKEQCAGIKFCMKLEENAKEMFKILEVTFGEQARE
jgi:uncharacterized metal-binding protein